MSEYRGLFSGTLPESARRSGPFDRIQRAIHEVTSALLVQMTMSGRREPGKAAIRTNSPTISWFMKKENEGLGISATTLRELGARGIELSLDIYAGDGDKPTAPEKD